MGKEDGGWCVLFVIILLCFCFCFFVLTSFCMFWGWFVFYLLFLIVLEKVSYDLFFLEKTSKFLSRGTNISKLSRCTFKHVFKFLLRGQCNL